MSHWDTGFGNLFKAIWNYSAQIGIPLIRTYSHQNRKWIWNTSTHTYEAITINVSPILGANCRQFQPLTLIHNATIFSTNIHTENPDHAIITLRRTWIRQVSLVIHVLSSYPRTLDSRPPPWVILPPQFVKLQKRNSTHAATLFKLVNSRRCTFETQ